MAERAAAWAGSTLLTVYVGIEKVRALVYSSLKGQLGPPYSNMYREETRAAGWGSPY